MRRERSLSIENRILTAVVSICVLSILCFGYLLVRGGYVIKMTQERETGEELLDYISWDITQFGQEVGPQAILSGCQALENESLVIYDQAGTCILGADTASRPEEELQILTQRSDNRFGWRLYYMLDVAAFWDDLISEQKYGILATIALLIITIQVGVFVSYGISEPVRRLAGVCAAIGSHPQQASPELIPLDVRGTETKQLAEAFRQMLSELKRYTAALAEQKALNESIVENLPLGVAAYGADGQVLLVNDRAAAMLADGDFTAGGETLRMVLEHHLCHGSAPYEAIRFENGSGDARIYQIGVWRLRRDGGAAEPGTLCTIDDVTYDKIMEEKVSENEKLAYTGKLAAMLAHEIRNPLAGIRASIQVMGRGMERERDRTLCSSVLHEVDRINILIEDLLNLSRKRESHKSLVELRTLMGEVSLLYSKLAENHGITMETETETGLAVYADESEMKQILVNLVSNSLKAVGQGGRISLRARREEAGVVLVVSDDGAGIDPQRLRAIREGIASGRSERYGLAIVNSLLSRNDGEMKIESTPGRGTQIELRFRRADGGEETR